MKKNWSNDFSKVPKDRPFICLSKVRHIKYTIVEYDTHFGHFSCYYGCFPNDSLQKSFDAWCEIKENDL